MGYMNTRVACALVALVCATPALDGQQRPQRPEATFRVQVDAVEVDAVVTDAQGNLITDLTREDFQVLEDGKPQTISFFSLVHIPIERVERPLFERGPIEPDVQSNNRGDGRLYIIALDESIGGEQVLRTRRFLRRFIEQYFAAS